MFTDADHTKLDTVETNADITDATNVTAAGALMDSEVTNLAQVKAFDSSDYATAAQGTKADASLPKAGGAMTGAITTNSTFDGRDVAADGVTADAALPKSGGAMTGAITTNSTFDGVDIATRDGVLSTTTTTANAALPKSGGAMTGAITTNSTIDGRDVAADGVTADAALPKSGGAMTGAITTNSTFDGRDVAADGVTADAALPKSGGAMTGAITTNSTFDGVDVGTRDAVLTSTTTTANAALPKAGGEMNGALTIDVDNVAAGALRIEANQTNPNQDFYFAQEIYSTLSGSTALTSDREQGGIYMDINSTATGGDTSQEHRVYGAYLDVDSTGDADLVYGIYSNVTVTPTTGQTSTVFGGYFYAEDNGGAGSVSTVYGLQSIAFSDNATSDTNAMYAGYFKTANAADSGAIGTATTVYGEIEIVSGSADIYGTSKVFEAHYDNNATVAQTNTTYLYYGNYAGVRPTTAYGVYIEDPIPNVFIGSVRSGLGNTSVAGYGFNGDSNTGMYSPANHEVEFQNLDYRA
mgnify:CR=1 FL=1